MTVPKRPVPRRPDPHQNRFAPRATPKLEELMYDWNPPRPNLPGAATRRGIEVVDETLRDGLQGGVPTLPTPAQRAELVRRAARLGIREMAVGFPAHREARESVSKLLRALSPETREVRLGLLGRMVLEDIDAIATCRDRSRNPVSAWLFLGASPIRRFAEEWSRAGLEEMTDLAFAHATRLGLPVNFGIEDTSRAEPGFVESLIDLAASHGIETLSLCDTVGCLVPDGVRRLVTHYRGYVNQRGYSIRLDFHGHRDRGLALANSLAAAEAGIDRIHGTLLGVGERAGNCPLDLLLVNLRLLGHLEADLTSLPAYCERFARSCDLEIDPHYPIFGQNAFRTQAGVHAAAIDKSETKDDSDVAHLVYAGIDPRVVGRRYDIQVGPESGRSNVRYVLRQSDLSAEADTLDAILDIARTEHRFLEPIEVCALAASLSTARSTA